MSRGIAKLMVSASQRLSSNYRRNVGPRRNKDNYVREKYPENSEAYKRNKKKTRVNMTLTFKGNWPDEYDKDGKLDGKLSKSGYSARKPGISSMSPRRSRQH